ncbi:MAG: helix-turn-helix domain-containing protein [Natronosporangium sp.]
MKETEHYIEYQSVDELVRDLELTDDDLRAAGERIDDHVRAWHLAQLRRAQGQTQRQLAAVMHVSQPRVHDIEHGNSAKTTVEVLRAYVTALGGELEVVARFGDNRYRVA